MPPELVGPLVRLINFATVLFAGLIFTAALRTIVTVLDFFFGEVKDDE